VELGLEVLGSEALGEEGSRGRGLRREGGDGGLRGGGEGRGGGGRVGGVVKSIEKSYKKSYQLWYGIPHTVPTPPHKRTRTKVTHECLTQTTKNANTIETTTCKINLRVFGYGDGGGVKVCGGELLYGLYEKEYVNKINKYLCIFKSTRQGDEKCNNE
jgi:hypothetical protein